MARTYGKQDRMVEVLQNNTEIHIHDIDDVSPYVTGVAFEFRNEQFFLD